MKKISRRDFLKAGTYIAISMGLGPIHSEAFADGLEEFINKKHRVIWLQGQSCSGCSISLLNSANPGADEIITKLMSLAFLETIQAAQGEVALELLDRNISASGYILMVEGSIPMDMPKACMIGERTFEEILLPAIKNSKAVFAVGSCATFGGIPSAEGNLTGAASVKKFMEKNNLDKSKLIALPLCPAHPESIIGTLIHYVKYGFPERDKEYNRPKKYYSRSVHAECPRYHYYQNEIFATDFGDENACLFKLGCLGPLSYTNCPRRQWNNGTNWCIRANANCISCSSEYFGENLKKDLSFFRKTEKYKVKKFTEENRKGN